MALRRTSTFLDWSHARIVQAAAQSRGSKIAPVRRAKGKVKSGACNRTSSDNSPPSPRARVAGAKARYRPCAAAPAPAAGAPSRNARFPSRYRPAWDSGLRIRLGGQGEAGPRDRDPAAISTFSSLCGLTSASSVKTMTSTSTISINFAQAAMGDTGSSADLGRQRERANSARYAIGLGIYSAQARRAASERRRAGGDSTFTST